MVVCVWTKRRTNRKCFSNDSVSYRQSNFRNSVCDWRRNKARYMTIPDPYGLAGAVFEVARASGQEQWGQDGKNMKKMWLTDQPTDGRTKRGEGMCSRRLKTVGSSSTTGKNRRYFDTDICICRNSQRSAEICRDQSKDDPPAKHSKMRWKEENF